MPAVACRSAPRERLAIVMSFATMFCLGLTISLLGPSLPSLAKRLSVSLADAGVLFSLFAAGSLVATVLAARLMDRPIRHALLVGGAFLTGGALWFLAGSATLPQAGLAVALAGLAISTAGAAPNTILAEYYHEDSARALNVLHLIAGAGAFIGPLLVGLAIRLLGDYAVAFRLVAGLEILLGLLWITSRPPHPRHSEASGSAPPAAALRPLALLILFALLYVGAEQTVGGWIFTFAGQVVRLEPIAASLATSAFSLAMIAGRLAATQVLPRTGNLPVLMGGVILGGLGIGLVLFSGAVPALLWLGVGLVGLGFGPVFPTTLAEGARITPAHVGLTCSLLIAAGSTGSMTMPWASGTLMRRLSIRATLASTEIALLLMLACLLALQRLRKAQRS